MKREGFHAGENRKAERFKIHIRYKSASRSVDVRDIDYVESRDKLLLFHLKDGRILRRYGRLENLAEELPEHCFFRCYQSYVVNLARVSELGENAFRVGEAVIPVSRKYKKQAKERYFAFVFSQMGGRHSS